MADKTETYTIPSYEENKDTAPAGADPFVIRPEPTAESIFSKDGIYAGNATPYVEAVIRGGSTSNIQVSSILICGNVSLLSDSAIGRVTETCHVVVAGKKKHPVSSERKAHYYETVPTEEKFSQLFDAYDIDTVWYISGYADGQNGMDNELKYLECVVKTCSLNAVSKLIVVSSVESLNFHHQYDIMGRLSGRAYASTEAFATAQMEDFVRYYAKNYGLKAIILRTPYIASEWNDTNFLGQIFDHMLSDKKLVFPFCPENKIDFLSGSDLIELLLDVSEESEDETATYSVTSGYHYTWRDLEEEILKLVPETSIEYEQNMNFISIQSYSIELKRKYGFIPMDNVLDFFFDAFESYKKSICKESRTKKLLQKFRDFLVTKTAGYIELILFFLLTEYLVKQTGTTVYFKYVDLRLFYVVIMGTIYGMSMGILAGILTGISLFFQFRDIGLNGTMLFYNLENWLPFVVYLITGSITGYISNVRRQETSFLQKEYDLLRQKYLFLNDVYHGTIENKSEYKRQILGYKDSFGVIFQAVQKLDSVLPQEIFMNGIQTMEDILKNHSIAIYTIDDWQKYGRLAASSGELLENLSKSIEIASIEPVYHTIQNGDVWKNTELLQGMPMYAYGICDKGKVDLMIVVYNASPEQLSLYYLNLFKILCNLVKLSFIRALEYQRAIEQENYFPDTLVVIPSYFSELLHAQKELMDAGLASYALIRFASKDKTFISESLRGLIRSSDIIGADDEGSLFLILTQINHKSLQIVENRLMQKGLKFEIVIGN